MKPTNKRQEHLVNVINPQIKPIFKPHYDFAVEKLFKHNAIVLKSGKITCLDCGHSYQHNFKEVYQAQISETHCPKCKRKWDNVKHTKKRTFNDYKFMMVIDRVGDVQVLRHFKFSVYYSLGKRRKIYSFEVGRIFIYPDGKHEVIGYSKVSYYYDQWGQKFCLKKPKTADQYYMALTVYPKIKIAPTIKRNGFKGALFGFRPFFVFKHILTSNIAETFWKTKNHAWFLYYGENHDDKNDLNIYWSAMKLCIKHGYTVHKDQMSTYFDYLKLCLEFGKDISNVKYACPIDLNKRHDVLVEKKRKIIIKEKLNSLKKTIKEDSIVYDERIKKFIDLEFKSKNLIVRPVKDVQEMLFCGEVLRHCLFTNEYHRKENSLILVALEGNTVLETAEIKLNYNNPYLDQCRGFGNKASVRHSEIVSIIESNMHQIKDALKPKPKRKPKSVKQLQVA